MELFLNGYITEDYDGHPALSETKDDFGNYKVKLDADNPWDIYRGVSVPPDIAEFKGYDLQLIEYI